MIVLNEASMAGSCLLDQLRTYVDAAGAKIVLLGGKHQLSIDAGGWGTANSLERTGQL